MILSLFYGGANLYVTLIVNPDTCFFEHPHILPCLPIVIVHKRATLRHMIKVVMGCGRHNDTSKGPNLPKLDPMINLLQSAFHGACLLRASRHNAFALVDARFDFADGIHTPTTTRCINDTPNSILHQYGRR